jgi:hypothetical protein
MVLRNREITVRIWRAISSPFFEHDAKANHQIRKWAEYTKNATDFFDGMGLDSFLKE